MAKNLEVKLHQDGGRTTLQIRVDVIANGFVVKTGGKPYFAGDIAEVAELTTVALGVLQAEVGGD
ncbi:unnamed protein product [marine sediment metagenome]|uniref:Uncharacterized protein n=1 Tax=marine sediment metagenome TaxID=412755 RepID=X0WB47_9ZZZZ